MKTKVKKILFILLAVLFLITSCTKTEEKAVEKKIEKEVVSQPDDIVQVPKDEVNETEIYRWDKISDKEKEVAKVGIDFLNQIYNEKKAVSFDEIYKNYLYPENNLFNKEVYIRRKKIDLAKQFDKDGNREKESVALDPSKLILGESLRKDRYILSGDLDMIIANKGEDQANKVTYNISLELEEKEGKIYATELQTSDIISTMHLSKGLNDPHPIGDPYTGLPDKNVYDDPEALRKRQEDNLLDTLNNVMSSGGTETWPDILTVNQ